MPPGPAAQTGFAYRFDWGTAGARALVPGAGAVVVVDVLSFTTCVDVALAAGAAVVPARGHDTDATEVARRLGSVVAARQRSLAAPSLSPSSLRRLSPGTRLVLPSPNGATVALAVASLTSAPVFAGCFRNARAAFVAARPRLAEAVAESASARELAERGFAADVGLAVELDVSPLAPRLDRGAFVPG